MTRWLRGDARPLAVRMSVAYAVVCLALWPIPVFGLLHAESSAVIAGVGCFGAAILGTRVGTSVSLPDAARGLLLASGVPLLLLLASMLWRPNCGWPQGLAFYALFVPPSVLFGLAVGAAVSAFDVRWPRATAAGVVLGAALGGVVLDLRFHPQLFTYSHVFGGVVGPIYDEELAMRPGLFAAKAQTLLWVASLLAIASWRRYRTRLSTWMSAAALLALGASYAAGAPLGIVQSEAGIQSVLSERVDLGPVVLHLAPDTPEAERQRVAEEALFRFETLARELDVVPDEPVNIYLYPDPDTKGALIGSRTTSVVPVWLPSPQVHMLTEEVGRSLAHELVHVLAREFGMPVIRASPAVGLVEGLAVALEPPDGLPGPEALVRAGAELSGDGAIAPAEAVRRTMSPTGFWTARSGVAYTANGAFVRWLLDEFGPEPVKEAYRSGRFAPTFGQSLAQLASSWDRDLRQRAVDPEAVAVAEWLFSRPSLFERRCPHFVPSDTRQVRAGDEARERGEVAAAGEAYREAVALNPYRLDALRGALGTGLAQGIEPTRQTLTRAEALADSLPSPAVLLHLADVRRLLAMDADAVYAAARDSLAPVDGVGRLLVARRQRLGARPLATLLASGPTGVPDAMERAAPVLAALRHAAADRPQEAWRLARRWCPDSLAGESAEATRVLRLLQAQIALRAGALRAGERLATASAAAFREAGATSYAALSEDLRQRARWRRAHMSAPSILTALPDSLDALVPCPARRAPAGVRVRAAGGGL